MSKKILILSLAIFLFAPAGLQGAEAPKLASRIPDNALAAVFIKDFPSVCRGIAWMSNLSQVFVGEMAIALLSMPEEEQMPSFIVMGKVNPDKLQSFLEARLKPILRRNVGKVDFHSSKGLTEIVVNESPIAFYAVKDELLGFSLDRNAVADVISKPMPAAKSFHANPRFAKVLERIPPDSRSIFFANVKRILDTFGDEMPGQEGDVLKSLGILDIQAAAGYDTVTDGAQLGSLCLITSGKPRGVLALLGQAAAPPPTARYVPGDYSFYARLRFSSFSDAWSNLMNVLQDMSPGQAQEHIANFLEGFRWATELDFDSDLLDSLGGEVAVAVAVPERLRIPEGLALLEVRNREKVEKIMAKILPDPLGRTDEYKGVAIRTSNLGPVTAAFAFLDKYLVMGTDVSVVKSVVDVKAAGGSLAENPAFRSAFARLGEGSHLFYLDVGSALPLCLSAFRHFAASFSEKKPDPQPPTWEVIGKVLMSPLLTDCVVALSISGDEESVTFRAYSTLRGAYRWLWRGSTLLGGILPALTRPMVRKKAREATCLNNLKQLVYAERCYSADHRGMFSDKLSDLYPDYVDYFDIFMCPDAGGPKITKKEEIDSQTSYILRKRLTEKSPAGEVLIYENPSNHGGKGGNAAFVDGHVEWLNASELEHVMEKDERK